jgi:hypothetical protein
MIIVTLYILIAIVQAVLVARYSMPKDDGPVLMVVLMMIFAPIVSIVALGFAFHHAVTWLVTYKR